MTATLIRTFHYFLFLQAATSVASAQDRVTDSIATDVSTQAAQATRGYKDLYLLLGIGTGEVAGFKAEAQFFRGLYATVGTGVSFVPFPTGYLLTPASQLDYGIAWRWYNLSFTPVLFFRGSKAFWKAGRYDATSDSSIDVLEKADVLTLLMGVEYRDNEGATAGVTVGGNCWNPRNSATVSRLIFQLYGGVSF